MIFSGGGIIHGFISRLRDSFGRMSRGSGGNQSRANRGGGVGRNNFRGRNQRGGAARSFRGSRNNNLKFRGGGGGRGSGGIAFRYFNFLLNYYLLQESYSFLNIVFYFIFK